MERLLTGNIGLIEEIFGAELVPEGSRHQPGANVITPARIAEICQDHVFSSRLSERMLEQRMALLDRSMYLGTEPVEDYRKALRSDRDRTMLISDQGLYGGLRPLKDGLRVVPFFGRVLVDDPLTLYHFGTFPRRPSSKML